MKTIKCKICGEFTSSSGTKLCDRCWELNSRIRLDLNIAKKIIANIKKEK